MAARARAVPAAAFDYPKSSLHVRRSERTAVVLIEFQNDFTSEGGVLHDAVRRRDGADRDARQHARAGRGGTRGRRDDRACTDHVRARLRRALRPPLRHPQGRRRLDRVRQGRVGRRDRRCAGAAGGRRGRRGQARARHVRDDEPRLHPARARDHHDRARRLPHELLRRVDHAHGLREGLPGDHPVGLRGSDLAGGARERDPLRLPDVLRRDVLGGAGPRSCAERPWPPSDSELPA